MQVRKKGSRKDFKRFKKVSKFSIKDAFLLSIEWRYARDLILKQYGRQCMKCKTTKGEMHVDHIRARSRYPLLALSLSNLQVLCAACNSKKGAKTMDFRGLPEGGL